MDFTLTIKRDLMSYKNSYLQDLMRTQGYFSISNGSQIEACKNISCLIYQALDHKSHDSGQWWSDIKGKWYSQKNLSKASYGYYDWVDQMEAC